MSRREIYDCDGCGKEIANPEARYEFLLVAITGPNAETEHFIGARKGLNLDLCGLCASKVREVVRMN